MRRLLGVLLTLVVVIVALAVGLAFLLDGRIRTEADQRIATSLRDSVPFTVTPTVRTEGYPYVWHLVTRNFPSVRVQGAEMPVKVDEQTTLPLYEVDFTLRNVSPDTKVIKAGSLSGTGRLAYADLSRLAQSEIKPVGGDRVAVERDIEVYGFTLKGRLTAGLELNQQAQSLSVRDPELDVAGVRVPDQATDAIVASIVQPFVVPLPYGLRLDAVTPTEDGVRVDVVGQDVEFPVQP